MLVLLFHFENVVVEPLTMFIALAPKFAGKKSRCESKKWISKGMLYLKDFKTAHYFFIHDTL